MRRRVSIARMLCSGPDTLLLDEPFGALDAQLRGDLQRQLLDLWTGSGRTVVFVTHDIEEALILADRIVVLGALGSVVLDMAVDLPRPRDADEIRMQPNYLHLYRALADAIRQATQ
jgi:NitT/TauT family transport system ATP-binding protein